MAASNFQNTMATDLNSRYQDRAQRWRAVVDHSRGLLVVNAGPGTGKTYSLLRKVEALLERGVPPGDIYYLTFVNSIVDAFKADVAKPQARGGLGRMVEELGIRVTTLHSLAFKVVRTYANRLKLPAHLEVIDSSPRPKALGNSVALADLLTVIRYKRKLTKRDFDSDLKALQRAWQDDASVPGSLGYIDDCFSRLQAAYELLPWDRLALLANRAIVDYGLPLWLQRPTHFLVDEYQDFNRAEQRHIELISKPSESVVIVGDVDQSIYSSRSASPRGLQALLQRDGASTVNFVLCRRCPPHVTEAANRVLGLIDPAGHAVRALEPLKTDPGQVGVLELKSCKAECDELAARIRGWTTKGVRTVLLLFPSHKAMNFYKSELEKRGVVEASGGAGRNDLLTEMLKLAVHSPHPFLDRLLLSTHPALERRFVDDVLPLMLDEGLSLEDALTRAAATKPWQTKVRKDHETLSHELEELRSKDPDRITSVLAAKDLVVDRATVVAALASGDTTNGAETVAQAPASGAAPPGHIGTRVRFLTMHGSKGLSEPIVVLPGMEDKWLPGSALGEALLEKHRLFYVALTRAEDEVLLTHPNTRARGDPLNYRPSGTILGPSRYADLLKS